MTRPTSEELAEIRDSLAKRPVHWAMAHIFRVLLSEIDALTEERDQARSAADRIREALCLGCGRSLPPDGDCYGCEIDQARGESDRYRARLDEVLRERDESRAAHAALLTWWSDIEARSAEEWDRVLVRWMRETIAASDEYRLARGCAPSLTGISPEEAIRRGR